MTPQAPIMVAFFSRYPLMLKSRTLAYDGRGNAVVKTPADVEAAIQSLVSQVRIARDLLQHCTSGRNLMVRRTAGFVCRKVVPLHQRAGRDGGSGAGWDSAVIPGRGDRPKRQHLPYGDRPGSSVWVWRSSPTQKLPGRGPNTQDAYGSLQISGSIQTKAREMAEAAVATFDGAGIYGVEMFVSADGEVGRVVPCRGVAWRGLMDTGRVVSQVVVNEIAPRPHNSGHYTIEACYTSQFENHVRAVLGLPLGACDMKVC